MEKYHEVWKQTLDLCATIQDAICYMEMQVDAGDMQDTRLLIRDISDALASIQDSMDAYSELLPENELKTLSANVKETLDVLTWIYLKNDANEAKITIEAKLHPDFDAWYLEMRSCLQPYIVH